MALDTNLVAYYTMEGNGNDATGNGFNGTASSITFSSGNGKISQGAGTTGGEIRSSGSLNQTASMSVSAWVNQSTTASDPYIWIWGNTNAGSSQFALSMNSGKFNVSTYPGGDGNGGVGTTVTTNGVWYHVVVVDDNGTGYIYVNGTQEWTGTLNVLTATGSSIVIEMFQNFGFGVAMQGAMDEVGLWQRALTSGEVTTLYNGGTGLAYPFSSPVNSNFLAFM